MTKCKGKKITIFQAIEFGLSEHRINVVKKLLPIWLKNSSKEWNPVDKLELRDGKFENCSLCGRKNYNVFYIENSINKKRINVGSECVKAFDDNFFRRLQEFENERMYIKIVEIVPRINEISD